MKHVNHLDGYDGRRWTTNLEKRFVILGSAAATATTASSTGLVTYKKLATVTHVLMLLARNILWQNLSQYVALSLYISLCSVKQARSCCKNYTPCFCMGVSWGAGAGHAYYLFFTHLLQAFVALSLFSFLPTLNLRAKNHTLRRHRARTIIWCEWQISLQ